MNQPQGTLLHSSVVVWTIVTFPVFHSACTDAFNSTVSYCHVYLQSWLRQSHGRFVRTRKSLGHPNTYSMYSACPSEHETGHDWSN